METKRINMGAEPKGKKETERLNVNTDNIEYREPVNGEQEDPAEEDVLKKNPNVVARVVAAGIGGAALGSGVAMAAGRKSEQSETELEEELEAAAKPKPTRKEEKKSEDKTEEKQEEQLSHEDKPMGEEGPMPETSPHIEEILVDPDDLDGSLIMNIEGTSTVEIEGTEFNTAIVTDEAGNTYYMVDVDGIVGDPNATYDIIVDAETGEMVGLPTNISQSDAELMSENGIAYVEPTVGDSNNIAQAEMDADIYDPSQPIDEEPILNEMDDFDALAENSFDSTTDIIDSLV